MYMYVSGYMRMLTASYFPYLHLWENSSQCLLKSTQILLLPILLTYLCIEIVKGGSRFSLEKPYFFEQLALSISVLHCAALNDFLIVSH